VKQGTCVHGVNDAPPNLNVQKPGLIGPGFVVSLQKSKAARQDLHRH
jgi:hypothetical protein